MEQLRVLGWSQERVAYVIGCTRPALVKHRAGEETLTIEQKAKLDTLIELNMTYRAFERAATGAYAFERIWKPSYLKLANVKQGIITKEGDKES